VVWTFHPKPAELPEDGQKLVQGFEADRETIQKEADQKVEARRESLLKALQALQDQYAKEGKLDEAVAIRDYIRAGGPGGLVAYNWLRRR
jgi:excinuclease UvrABC helicase subunit UvrB